MLPPCPDPFNLAAYVLAPALTQPDKLALAILSPARAQRWRYGQLLQAVQGVAAGLTARGLAPGDRVLLRLGNTVDFPIAFLGAIAAGMVPVPTSSQLTRREITAMAAVVDPACVIAGPGIALPECGVPVITTEALEGMFELPGLPFHMGAANRPAYIIFTSGTGGSPRGVVHAHRAVWARRMMWQGWYDLREDDRVMHAGAFNWTYTLGTGLMDPWAIGATALVPQAGVDPAQIPLLLKRHDATIFAAAPGVYRQILKHPVSAMPRLRHGLSAGEKLPETVRAAWQSATGTMIYEALGMSECSTFISGSPSRPAPPGTAGYAQTGRRIAALDDALHPVPPDQPGQLAVDAADPGLMLGYWNDPDATNAKIRNGWFLTGDMVSVAPTGAVTYLGRNDDLLNAGGYRVSPLDVENAMLVHDNITACAAIEVEVKAGTRVIALAYEGTETDAGTLMSFAAERLARYKQPRLYRHVAHLPMVGNGKINRRALRKKWDETA